jgi:hypothetical protein
MYVSVLPPLPTVFSGTRPTTSALSALQDTYYTPTQLQLLPGTTVSQPGPTLLATVRPKTQY